MRSRIVLAGVFALVVVFAARTGFGALVTMEFIGPQGNNSGGVYVYPYEFNIDSSTTTYLLQCDDFNHEISAGQTWQASTLDVTDLNATTVNNLQFPSAGVGGYLEACDLFFQEINAYTAGNSDPEGLYNWAVWDLLTATDVSNAHLGAGDESVVQSYISAAVAAGPGLTVSDFNGVTIYTPTDMSSGGPQEFLGYTPPVNTVPEPGSIGVLGLGAGGLVMRRRRRAGR